MDKANDADDVASRALRTVVGADENNFSGTDYSSLNDASKAQDAEDAKEAAKIVKKGDDATPEEIDKVNKYFKDNMDDPYFAERFALEVGPKGSLRTGPTWVFRATAPPPRHRPPRQAGGAPEELEPDPGRCHALHQP